MLKNIEKVSTAMEIIKHRINSIESLNECSLAYGAEIDVRYHNNALVLDHDPFHGNNAQQLESFLINYELDGTLIINLKTEGIERSCIELLQAYKIRKWFFLDMSQPYLVKFSLNTHEYSINRDNLAVRFSEFEPIEYALSFSGKVGWVWVDRFQETALTLSAYESLIEAGFKLCLVSPELHGHDIKVVTEYINEMSDLNIHAVCTKYPEMWGDK